MTTLDFSKFNRLVTTVVEADPSTFDKLDISYQDVVLSLPFKLVEERDEDYFIRRKYVLDTGAHHITYVYTYDGYDDEDSYDFFINKSAHPKFGTEKLIGSKGSYLHAAILHVVAELQVYLDVMKKESMMNTLNLEKTSFSKKELRANLEILGVCEPEITFAIDSVKKTMIGKAEALPFLVHTCVSYYSDDTGLIYTVDQFLSDVNKKLGKTFTSQVLNTTLKDIWVAVAPSLSQHPKGHMLIKNIVVGLHNQFNGKPTVGIAQVRTAIYELALQGYAAL